MRYSEPEIERIAHVAFRTARAAPPQALLGGQGQRARDDAAVARRRARASAPSIPDVELTHLFVDAAAMQLMRAPKQFDVMVTGNVFGDILSDAAAMLTGSIGMLPSASLADGRKGLYEPVHGTAPDIAGRDIANPLAAILSAAMMLRYSFDRPDLADASSARSARPGRRLPDRGHLRAGHEARRHAGDGRCRGRGIEDGPDLKI